MDQSWSSTTGFSDTGDSTSMGWSPTVAASGGEYSATTGPLVTYAIVDEIETSSASESSRGNAAPLSDSTTLIVRLESSQYFLIGRERYTLQLQAITGKNATVVISPGEITSVMAEGETRRMTVDDGAFAITLSRVTTDSVTVRIAPVLSLDGPAQPPVQLPDEQKVTPAILSGDIAKDTPEETSSDHAPIAPPVPGEKSVLIIVFIIAAVILLIFIYVMFFRKRI